MEVLQKMAKKNYQEVLIATEEEGIELYRKLTEAGKLEKAIELTKAEAEKMMKKAKWLFYIVIGWVLPYGLKAAKLWQGVYMLDENFELKGKQKWAFLYGWCYVYIVGYLMNMIGIGKKQSYTRVIVPLD